MQGFGAGFGASFGASFDVSFDASLYDSLAYVHQVPEQEMSVIGTLQEMLHRWRRTLKYRRCRQVFISKGVVDSPEASSIQRRRATVKRQSATGELPRTLPAKDKRAPTYQVYFFISLFIYLNIYLSFANLTSLLEHSISIIVVKLQSFAFLSCIPSIELCIIVFLKFNK